jgi:hypothetical protein|tara:strand:+ start:73 stop:294 length:222 start_codon:yes stop_codon:yes gene_type:complete
MSREVFFVCDRCRRQTGVAALEAHKIPENWYNIYMRVYDRDKKMFGSRLVEVCAECSAAIGNAFDKCMNAEST